MSHLFIKQQNQELLWRIINQTPQMQTFFQGAQHGAREAWFQQIIQHVYAKSAGINISLKDLNKEAIQLMLDLLQQAEQPQPQPQPQIRPINKEITTNALYESRLKEYETEKKTPEQPLQLTPFKDDAIQDLGSAVSEYMKSREKDIVSIPPPTGTQHKKSVSWEDDNPILLKILNKLSVLEDKIDTLQKELKNINIQNNAEPV